ncbi:MAG TPA: hypothetical protein VFJ89_02280 [Nocardioides sp.]|jgi:hypothetical protein|nr:hypothetical protein [Nocardioides sp.]
MGDRSFAEAFAAALERRGVSLSWLHQRLVELGHPVSPAALSYWRSGRSQPERGTSRDALVEVERLLRVPPGELVDRLGPSRRPGPRPAEKTLTEMYAETPGMETALQTLGFEGLYDEVVENVRHITLDVDADGRAYRYQVRAVMQARRDGARRTPLLITQDSEGRVPRFVPVAGCRLGRESFDSATRVYAVELLLDRTLRKDETSLYELTVELPEPIRDTCVDHYAARRLHELLVWVRFDPARLPSYVERYTQIGREEHSVAVALGGGSGAHAMARGFGPGILGLRWEW